MLKQIDIERLSAHPDAPSRMSRIMIKKLSQSIQTLGLYEAIVVRSVGNERYQILDGHSRIESLRTLSHKKVTCDIWDVDENTARLFIAACNSVRGGPVPELRMALLFDLLDQFSPAELGAMLPESETHLLSLLAFEAGEGNNYRDETKIAISDKQASGKPAIAQRAGDDIIMTLRMTKSQYKKIETVLKDFMRKVKIHDMNEAITKYLLNKVG